VPVQITSLLPSDHDDWFRLWGLYQDFYEVCIPDNVSAATWARLLDPAEPMWGALARDGASPIGLVHHIRHRTCWDIADSCYLQDLYVDEDAVCERLVLPLHNAQGEWQLRQHANSLCYLGVTLSRSIHALRRSRLPWCTNSENQPCAAPLVLHHSVFRPMRLSDEMLR
jgi:hypothetical protein